MAWTPDNVSKFDEGFMAGLDNFTLGKIHNSTSDKVNKYVSTRYKDNTLPRRGDFEPLKDDIVLAVGTDELDLRILQRLKKSQFACDLSDLANELDVSPKRIEEAILRLKSNNYLVNVDNGAARFAVPSVGTKSNIDLDDYNGQSIKFGIVSDTHLGSRYERLDVLNAIYDMFEQEGIKTVLLPGNYIEGEARFNKNDIHVHGLGNQVKYFCQHFPQREGITTHFIDGDDHEGWYTQREGVDIGQYTVSVARDEFGRNDLVCHGYMEADIAFPAPEGETIVRLQHPGGGSSYAVSYKSQKIVESLTGGEKPHILLIGHYHKSEYIHYRNIHVFQCGTTQDQSPFMRKKQLSAHVGGWIVEAFQAPDGGVPRVKMEWLSFYDKEHYEKKWSYKR